MSDLLDGVDPRGNMTADAMDAAILGALAIAQREETGCWNEERANVVFVAMGRYSGRECSYVSDTDAVALHEAIEGATEVEAATSATVIVNRAKNLLGPATNQLGIVVDPDLRPEGKNGPISWTIESHREYAQRQVSTWERQAAMRARPIGESGLADSARELLAELAYRGVNELEVRDIRLLKARMENERLPRGIEPARYVKLGPGGLMDVEWTIRLIQMRAGMNNPVLRTPSMTQAILSAREHELISAQDVQTLLDAWDMATRIRAANTLAGGRTSGVRLDVLPRGGAELRVLTAIPGYGSGGLNVLEDDWLRAGRKARAIMERPFQEQW